MSSKQFLNVRLLDMLMPSIYARDLFDDVFEPFYRQNKASFNSNGLMKTDVKETDEGYDLSIDLPGVSKDDIKAEVKDGYMTVSVTKNENNDEKDKKGKFIRRERFYGSYSRSFYVGEDVKEEDVKASFKNGILTVIVPEKEEKEVEAKKRIQID